MINSAPLRRVAAEVDDIRVMIADDAVVVRSQVGRWVADAGGMTLTGSARNGREALDLLARANPDVMVLDIDMPEMDGLSALPLMLRRRRDLAVIVVSTLTRRNAEIALKALALGAADCMTKPEAALGFGAADTFRHELVHKIRELGLRRRRNRLTQRRKQSGEPATRQLGLAIQQIGQWRAPDDGEVDADGHGLRPFGEMTPRVLLVGASTGGPQALHRLMTRLGIVTDSAPVLITQHMPPTFTTILAENLARVSGRTVREAEDGEEVRAGTVYIAPGGRHMRVARRRGAAVIALDDSAPEHFCRPAVDPLFVSAAEVWGRWNLAVVLTGMGVDGAAGAAAIAEAGGSVIAQDEASSVIWGMPRAALETGACSAVLPLEQIAPRVVRLFLGVRS